MSNTLFQFHGVKRGQEIKDFTISNLPQNAKIVINPIMKWTDAKDNTLTAIPNKAYLIYGYLIQALNAATDTGVSVYVNATMYDGTAASFGGIKIVPSVANCINISMSGLSLLTKPNTALTVTANNVGSYSFIVYYSEVDVVD